MEAPPPAVAADAAQAFDPPAELTHRQIMVVFGGLMAGMLLAALDQTIVSTALPTIVGELGGVENLSWIVTSYLLASTVSTPIYGKLSDLYGRKIVFQAAIVIFLVGSVLSGVAQSVVQLSIFRGIQGVGGGGLMAMAFAIVGDVVSPRQRGRYTGYLGAVFAFSSVVGPLLGGFFVDNLSWRWVFYVNIPVGLAALVITSSALKGLVVPGTRRRIDWLGAGLLVGGVTSLLLVLEWGGRDHPWASGTIVGLGVAGAVLTGLFVARQATVAEPILPLRLFREPVFSVSMLVSFLLGCAMFGGIIYLPVFLQIVTGASATHSGLLILPLMGGLMFTSITSGRMIARTGRYKVYPVVGSAVAAVGLYLLSTMTEDTGRVTSGVYMAVLGVGIGLVMQVLILAVQNAADFRDLGVVTSSATFFRSMGGSFGVAIFGAILTSRLTTLLPQRLPAGAAAAVEGEVTSLVNSPEVIRAAPPLVQEAIISSVRDGISDVFLFAVPIMVLGFVATLFLREYPLRDTAAGPSSAPPAARPADGTVVSA